MPLFATSTFKSQTHHYNSGLASKGGEWTMPDFLVNNAQFLGGCSEFFLVMVYYNRTPNLKCVAALLTTTVILLCRAACLEVLRFIMA